MTGLAETLETEYNSILTPGDLISGRYRIERALAEGGMGRVYVATQEPLGRRVALKVMRRELVSDEMSVKRFLREAVAVSQLHHPNTITVLDYGEAPNNVLFIAMELLEGESLHQLLEREKRLSIGVAVSIISQVARSLAEAHTKGVIHRDLKPENIFISHVEGEGLFVKVLDFGIAKLQASHDVSRITRAGFVCGTPEYMSPEQARAEELDGTSDLYALGVLLWEMLEGRVPYEASTPLGTVLMHQSDPIPELTGDVPEALKAFVYKAMAKDRAERPSHAEGFLNEMMAAVPAQLLRETGPSIRIQTTRLAESSNNTPERPMYNTAAGVATAPTMESSLDDLERLQTSPVHSKASSSNRVLLFSVGAAALALLCLVGVAFVLGVGAEPSSEVATPQSTLKVGTDPPRAQVFQDGVDQGAAPVWLKGDAGSEVKIEIRMPGYKTLRTTARLPESGEAPARYSLLPEPAVAAAMVDVRLETDPSKAMVVRDDNMIGNAPYTFSLKSDVEPFQVKVRLAGHGEAVVLIDPANGSKTMKVQLQAEAKPDDGEVAGEQAVKARVKPQERRAPTRATKTNQKKPEQKPAAGLREASKAATEPPAKPKEAPKPEPAGDSRYKMVD